MSNQIQVSASTVIAPDIAPDSEASLEDIFGQLNQLVANRPYLSEDDSDASPFDEFDQLVANRPYLQ